MNRDAKIFAALAAVAFIVLAFVLGQRFSGSSGQVQPGELPQLPSMCNCGPRLDAIETRLQKLDSLPTTPSPFRTPTGSPLTGSKETK